MCWPLRAITSGKGLKLGLLTGTLTAEYSFFFNSFTRAASL